MRLRLPIPVVVISGVVGLGAIAVAGAQESPRLQPAANPEVSYNIVLNGASEFPGPGDTDGTGQASITINATTGQVCVNLSTTGIDPISAMHIHPGLPGEANPPVVDFAVTSGTSAAKCVVATATTVTDAIIATPAAFYLNAHTAGLPNGAIRGQLSAATDTAGALHLLSEPLRAYDSRAGEKLVAGTARTVDLSTGTGSAGSAPAVPDGARAALVTITVTQNVGTGFLTAYSNALTVAPGTSTVNWSTPNTDVAATTTVAVDGTGQIALLAGQNGTHVIVDVIGYYV